jgi:regulator of sirC expression with transglutaminase-like and TPR domain
MTPQGTEGTKSALPPQEFLRRLGQVGDGPHDIAQAALMLAALDHPEKSLAPYRAHLSEIAEAAKALAGQGADIETAARALSGVIAGRYGYDGERSAFDESANADMISVIERRRGLPVILGILYIHAARAAGMESAGLFSPGHFLLRIARKGNDAVIDAFNGGSVLDRSRMTVPGIAGPIPITDTRLGDEPSPFDPVSDTDVLLRVLNNIRGRAIKAREDKRAAEIAGRMALIAPRRPMIWIELARLQESLGSLSAAKASYDNAVKASRPGDPFRNEAALALNALKRRLN